MNEFEQKSTTLTQEWSESARRSTQRELAAFREMLPNLLSTKKGEYVALSGGKVIDNDKDELVLVQRVSKTFPGKFVLIQLVSEAVSQKQPEGNTRKD